MANRSDSFFLCLALFAKGKLLSHRIDRYVKKCEISGKDFPGKQFSQLTSPEKLQVHIDIDYSLLCYIVFVE